MHMTLRRCGLTTLGVVLLTAGAVFLTACSSGVTQESHDELQSSVRELKGDFKALERTASALERDVATLEGGGEAAAASEGHGATATTAASDGRGATATTAASDGHGAAASAADAEEQHGTVHWAYTGSEGPATWGDLSPDFATCGSGVNQSPINLASGTAVTRGDIVFHYGSSALTVINNGHTIQANVEHGSTIIVGGASYELAQFHFHSPSEHTVNGTYFELEMHLVYVGAHGELAVVGVLFDAGATSAMLAPVWSVLPHDTASAGHVAQFDLRSLVSASGTLFRYSGSLTTPPCSEGVRWMLYQAPQSVSGGQIAAFQEIISANNRPVQPLNARELLSEASGNVVSTH